MADGRLRSEWRQTASLIAATFEPHRDRKKRNKPYSADDFDPFVKERRVETVRITKEQWRAMCDERPGKRATKAPEVTPDAKRE